MNPDEEELVPNIEPSIFPPFTSKAVGPPSHGWLIPPIQEEEEASVKDSITSGLPSREQNVGVEASRSSGQLTLSMMGQSKVYTLAGEDARDDEKVALVANKTEQKGKLSMDPMVESSW